MIYIIALRFTGLCLTLTNYNQSNFFSFFHYYVNMCVVFSDFPPQVPISPLQLCMIMYIYVTCVCGSEGNLFEDEITERRND